ncbi:hypothetical protein predicted by Glimmer/Critica [Acetobacter senegalensis]|uniref:Uncharacterized protein n=1 Tax=Acetobacter senegalensis TaxID=446692 RepID=A0A0U5ERR6_9PROT|nr:hypothetical protein predicted by Glimmer/Critica [Acetobacter senegalensis]
MQRVLLSELLTHVAFLFLLKSYDFVCVLCTTAIV